MCDLEILLQSMAVSVVLTLLPSMTLAWHKRQSPEPPPPPDLATHLSQPLVRLTQCELCARPSPVPVSAVVLRTTIVIIVTLSSSYSNLELGLQGLGDLAVEGWYFPLSLRTVLGVGAAGSLMWPLMGAAEAQTRGPGLEAALPLLWHQELLAALASGLGSDSVGASFWI